MTAHSPSQAVTALATGHLSDSELSVRGDDFDPTEPTPLNLVYSLLSLGWRISAVAGTDRITVKTLPPVSWDVTLTELAWQARGLSPASPVNIVLLRGDAAQFQLDEASSWVKGSGGEPTPIDFHALLGIALAIAPTQFMPDIVAAAPNWHSAGCATPQTSLPTDPHAIDDTDDIDDDVATRKQHLKEWLEPHKMRGPFATRAEVSDFIADHRPVGHYVLEFTDGSCYVGETVNFRDRFATHSKTYDGQIESFHLRYDPTAASLPARSKARKQQLINVERKLIHDAQKANLVARNFREMANPIEPSPEFTALFAAGTADEKIAQWFAHPDNVNASDPTSLQPLRTTDFGGAKDKFGRF